MNVAELFAESYYSLDLLVGFSSPLIFLLLYRLRKIERHTWHFYWIGALIGLAWEVPIFVLSGEATGIPIVVWHRPLLVHYSVFMVSHTLWDGLLFVIGIWLVRLTCRAPCFQSFRWPELLVLVLWGQASELLVEISSTANDGWAFVEYWWNPVIFECNGHNIAWLMQVIWLLASVLFYIVLLKLAPRYRGIEASR